jgi:hypothetical protein
MIRLFLLLTLFSSYLLNAQDVRKTLVKQVIRPFTFEHFLSYNIETGDSSDYVICSFQDMNYTSIIVTGSIFCSTQQSLEDTKSELNSIVNFMSENPGVNFTKGNYNIHDFAPKLIWYRDGTKTTRFNIVTAKKLLIALDSVKLRK